MDCKVLALQADWADKTRPSPYLTDMESEDIGRLAYLILLGVAVGGWFIAESRGNLGKTARQAAVWGMIFVGAIAVVGLWGDIRNDVIPRQSQIGDNLIEVPRGLDGHFHLILHLNDVPVEFVVDTGASDVVLSLADARRIGLDPDDLIFSGRANTANGVVATASTRVADVRLGDIDEGRMRVSVNGGEMDGSLLGMSYLQRFEKIEISRDRLLLTR